MYDLLFEIKLPWYTELFNDNSPLLDIFKEFPDIFDGGFIENNFGELANSLKLNSCIEDSASSIVPNSQSSSSSTLTYSLFSE